MFYWLRQPLFLIWAALLLFVSLPAISQSSPFAAKKIPAPDTVLVIHAGYLLAVPGKPLLKQQTIIVRGELVESIRPGFVSPAEIEAGEAKVELLDLSKHFVLPGLMDSHVHLSRATGVYQSGLMPESAPASAQATLNTLLNTQLTLNAGFTAVRDLGSDGQSVYAVRDAIAARKFIGPTIIASGPSIGVTGGHGSGLAGAAVCDGADACRSLTRQLEKAGADLIKIKISGGFSSNTGIQQHMTLKEIAAVVTAARMRALTVTAHAYDAEAISAALRAGVDCIEHGYLADDKNLETMRSQGVFLVPTLTVAEPPAAVKRFLRGSEPISVTLRNEQQAFERAYKLGVKIAFGTDAGIYAHGRNADELLTMVGLGMDEADAIRSATVVAAELFAVAGITGTVAAGSYADIIAVQTNPLEDISALQTVDWVIKFGQVVKRAGAMQPAMNFSLPQRY